MDKPADIDVRCSAIVFRGDAVLLIHRDGAGDWVLPGGTPRPWTGGSGPWQQR